MDALSLALLFVGAMSERLPSKMEAVFCLSSGKAKLSCLSCKSCLNINALISKLSRRRLYGLPDPFADIRRQNNRNIRKVFIRLSAAAKFSYKHELPPESGTVPAHQQMHPNQHPLIKRKPVIHRFGNPSGYLFTIEHPVRHHLFSSLTLLNQSISRQRLKYVLAL